ncbi:electron transfer flavoprotein subunit alpha/FixB family protein [Desulfitobacterium sp. AusDCA]|uniref:electron transfer flavoprotein subunit alpha/FixB family protein n=1 Tax=Desulfitobacterium sp. AusDCA TaxID=3240383 RepID=UPI003DA6D063
MRTIVFAEQEKAYAELCIGAGQLGSGVEAVRIGSQDQLSEEIKRRADKVWLIPAQSGAMLEDYTETIADLLTKEKPDLMLIEPTKRGKLIAGRLAALLGTSVLTDVMELSGNGQAKHLVYGGAAVRLEKAVAPTAIATIGTGVLDVLSSSSRQGAVVSLNFVEPSQRVKRVAQEQKPKSNVDLLSAKRVIAVGRGIAKEEDLSLIRELAEAVGGEVGCSRPIAEGEKWMPKEAYIGVSGLMLTSEVYMALGISGQVQHMVGCNRSKVVIAVNQDKNSPIFKQADYGIVADLYKVVPALIKHFK